MVDDTTKDLDGAARCVLAVRQMLREVISPELMLNPAVDMLLALYVGRRTTLSWQQVCDATRTSEDTCRRWGRALQEYGLVEMDDRRYRLTDEGERVMTEVNLRIWQITANHMPPDLRPPAD